MHGSKKEVGGDSCCPWGSPSWGWVLSSKLWAAFSGNGRPWGLDWPVSCVAAKAESAIMPERILIIDDDRIIRHLARTLLTAAGYVVIEAVDGPEGLQAATADPPNLILLDLQLPGMDGYAVCQHLKADPRVQAIPVIVLTASADRALHGQITRAGATACIPKPFRREALISTIALCLKQGTAPTCPVAPAPTALAAPAAVPPTGQLSFWGDYCIALAQRPEGSGQWFYSITTVPGREKPGAPAVGPLSAGPFASDTVALQTARRQLPQGRGIS